MRQEMKTDEWQRLNGAGAPQNDGNSDVKEGHEYERSDIEDEEIDHGVDANEERQSIVAVRCAAVHCDDVVSDQPRQRINATQQPRAANHDAVNCPISTETTVQHRMLDGHVALE